MDQVHFQVEGKHYSFGWFYVGMILSASVFTLFSAFLSWQLGRMAVWDPESAAMVGWALCGVQIASVALSCIYISVVPAVFVGVAAVLLGSWIAQTSRGRQEANAGLKPPKA